MEIKNIYEAPACETIELTLEAMLCISGDTNGYRRGNTYGGDEWFDED